MLRKLFAMSWFWCIIIMVNLAMAVNNFIDLDKEKLMFNLLCAAACSLAWITSKYREI
jgi:hypothetical protein|tara:strand:+ start:2147 stop:2320 length:174 start_codon:yes stop_codon:yes gene_type:complete